MKKIYLTLIAYMSILPAFADNIDTYINGSEINKSFEFLTGFNMRGVHQWIGEYLIKNFIGNIYGFFLYFKIWLIILFFLGGVLYLTLRAFSFYRH